MKVQAEDTFVDFAESVIKEGNIFSADPYMDNITFKPASNSQCIDAGKQNYVLNGKTLIEVDTKHISGSAPDIGAVENIKK